MNCLRPVCMVLLALSPSLSAAATRVPAQRMVEVARDYLQLRARSIPAEWEFTPSGALSASTVAGPGNLSIRAGKVDGPWPRSRVGVPVELLVDDVAVQTRMVWFTARAWRQAHVYASNYRNGDPSEGLKTLVRRIDIAVDGGDGIVPAEASDPMPPGQRLLRDVRAGQPVLARHLGPMPAVARNTRVALQVRQAGVALTTAALARDDGEVGDRVAVLPNGATQWVKAAVSGRNEVTIEN